MNIGVDLKKDNPIEKSGLFSKAIFGWSYKLIFKSYKTGLKVDDLFTPPKNLSTHKVTAKFAKNWKDELLKNKSNASLKRALFKTFYLEFIRNGIMMFVELAVLKIIALMLTTEIIILFCNDNLDAEGYLDLWRCGGLLILTYLIGFFLYFWSRIDLERLGMKIKIALSTTIYKKLLVKSINDKGTGEIMNLIGNDMERLTPIWNLLHVLWVGPCLLIGTTFVLWTQLGISLLFGVGFLFAFSIPFQIGIGYYSKKVYANTAKESDRRIVLIDQIISGMKVIKMYTWEQSFQKLVEKVRSKEIQQIEKGLNCQGLNLMMGFLLFFISIYITLVFYVLLNGILSSDKVFPVLYGFSLNRNLIGLQFPKAVSCLVDLKVITARLENYLKPTTKNLENESNDTTKYNDITKGEVLIENVQVSYHDALLFEIEHLKIHSGELVVVTGTVGSGKSSLLHLILKELIAECGTVERNGKISYCSQNPWLFGSTIRSNILFGEKFDDAKYREIIKTCCLEEDFLKFPHGDQSLVGEKGIILSGGQRARINLARCVYRDADIYLLDDPLSAVDVKVGRRLFQECIQKYLAGKTRILVTHQRHFAKHGDAIVCIDKGDVQIRPGTSSQNYLSCDEVEEKEEIFLAADEKKIIIEEETELQGTTLSPFRQYFQFANKCTLVILVATFFLAEFCSTGSNFFLLLWINAQNQTTTTTRKSEILDNTSNPLDFDYFSEPGNDNAQTFFTMTNLNFAILMYTLIILSMGIFMALRSILFFNISKKVGKKLHRKAFESMLTTPVKFFDRNPCGRILNRFTKDLNAVDQVFPIHTFNTLRLSLQLVGNAITVITGTVYVLVPFGIAFVLIWILEQKVIITIIKNTKYLESLTRSAVLSHAHYTQNGLITVRAFKAQEKLMKEFENHQDANTSAMILKSASNCPVAVVDFCCFLMVAWVIITFALLKQYSEINSAWAGLSLTHVLILNGSAQSTLRESVELINQLIPIERILQYIGLESEEFWEGDKYLIQGWPEQGRIVFENVSLRYSSEDVDVLKDISFEIQPCEKIGIVGRTGAGKSSLISALFRMNPFQGRILIDGVDTKQLSLGYLRKHISIIPQEPILFSNTIRFNLDPFSEYEDKEIWEALAKVHMKDKIPSLEGMVADGGNNFSLGEKQLMCLARAVLRKNKVLVMDEATANVDTETDFLIQTTIRREFKSCTVLTIAHRLNTVMDSDKILVMDAGRVEEFDHIGTLMENKFGCFYKLVQEMGAGMGENAEYQLMYD